MTQDKNLHFRPALFSDKDLLLEWRNDAETRQSSLQSEIVGITEHEQWLTNTLSRTDRVLWICESGGRAVGTVRFDQGPDAWELSWTVAPLARGTGIGKQMVRQASEAFGRKLMARIKSDNTASLKIAEYAGFALEKSVDSVTIWKSEPRAR